MLLSPLQAFDYSQIPIEYYEIAVFMIGGYALYYFVLRPGFMIHVMQPIGSDKNGNPTFYSEIGKKLFPFTVDGTVVNLFDNKGKAIKNESVSPSGKGKSYLVKSEDCSYARFRRRHIFFDMKSMIAIKLTKGTWNPSAKAWYDLFVLGMLGATTGNSTNVAKAKGSPRTTLVMVAIVGFSIGYFVALIYGHQLSPAFFNTSTSTSTTSSVISTTTQAINNATTIIRTSTVQLAP